MILIGMLDSPYVRRVAIGMKVLGLEHEHRPLSVFSDVDQVRSINPAVKVPTLVTDDGQVLMDSTLILAYLEELAAHAPHIRPEPGPARLRALCQTSYALAACDKAVQIVYERRLRPQEKQHQPWLDRVQLQLHGAWAQLEASLREEAPDCLSIAGITIAVAWSFAQQMVPDVMADSDYPAVAALTALAEQQPVFLATPMAG
ncbi:glutathione S-transferase [Janthinobacterium sp. PLB04]|uniref:Glutathione S-transferase n=1 Tax=Janthinobacterium lividum TaxID=29581 RepID=A0AAJ4MWQ2_9BURK|nr:MULTISPECIES: glutathione S-transferase [Janthinobacterium]KAB0324403.1 glutathione S-transferase [Janthinobacterium lividum]QSX98503.1 glutathione S-transferase [Janthinobacterium lividum]UGQ38463.1 glutathione S-transferase [Janthinobacterium sp. PLB04]